MPYRNRKITSTRRRKSTKITKLKKKFKTPSKLKWVVWSVNLSLAEAERQTTEMHLEGFLKNYRESARITGVNESSILRFYVILQNI